MPDRGLLPLRLLLPETLARIGQGSGDPSALRSLWRQVIGGPIAQNAVPKSLSGGVLRVEVASTAWRTTLRAEEPALRERLNAALRTTTIERLEFEVRARTP